jgi:hypothetical protein
MPAIAPVERECVLDDETDWTAPPAVEEEVAAGYWMWEIMILMGILKLTDEEVLGALEGWTIETPEPAVELAVGVTALVTAAVADTCVDSPYH